MSTKPGRGKAAAGAEVERIDLDEPATCIKFAKLVGISRQAATAMQANGHQPKGATLGQWLRVYTFRLRVLTDMHAGRRTMWQALARVQLESDVGDVARGEDISARQPDLLARDLPELTGGQRERIAACVAEARATGAGSASPGLSGDGQATSAKVRRSAMHRASP